MGVPPLSTVGRTRGRQKIGSTVSFVAWVGKQGATVGPCAAARTYTLPSSATKGVVGRRCFDQVGRFDG
jgi:hypothetical protein